jgi:hypothetical protein
MESANQGPTRRITGLTRGGHRPRRALSLLAIVCVTLATFLQANAGSAAGQGDTERASRAVPTTPPEGPPPARSTPMKVTLSTRPLQPGDVRAVRTLPPGYMVVDTVVSNTDPNLASTEGWPDGEPTVAVNPANSNRVVIVAFSSRWDQGNAAVFRTGDGGATWTKAYSIPVPTGVTRTTANGGCPCDQVIDYGRGSTLVGTFLDKVGTGVNAIYTGSTTNSGSATSWMWKANNGLAVKTDIPRGDNVDQPWLRVTRDPTTSTQDNAYVGYDDFTSPADIRVSVSPGIAPPSFTYARRVGIPGCCVNPGTRLAVDQRNGTVYVLWQYASQNQDGSAHVQYALNRSTDAGKTWSLNGSTSGWVVATANSNQPTPKFGGVNALLGGVDAIAVDNKSGDVYVVYGRRDETTLYNRLAIAHLAPNASGGLDVISRRYISGQFDAALPSVAVANGTVGVLYDKYEGVNASGYPVFTAKLAQSTDEGFTFSTVNLLSFSSAEKPSSDARQRVLGDYQSLRSLGGYFYGTFTGNGLQFGRSVSNMDPIFVKAPAL